MDSIFLVTGYYVNMPHRQQPLLRSRRLKRPMRFSYIRPTEPSSSLDMRFFDSPDEVSLYDHIV